MKLSEKYLSFVKDETGMHVIDKTCAKDSLRHGDCYVVIYAQNTEEPEKQIVEVLFDNYNEALDFSEEIRKEKTFCLGFIDHQHSCWIKPADRNLFYCGCWDLFSQRGKIKEINAEVEQ